MRALCLLVVLCAACADDPCDGVAGSCLGIRVTDGPELDQLEIVLTGALAFTARTPQPPMPAQRPPLRTAVALPDVTGALDVAVTGWRAGVAVGAGRVTATVQAGKRQTVALALTGGADLGDVDLAGADLTGAEADLAAEPDLKNPDFATAPNDKHIFVLPKQGPTFVSLTAADAACAAAADAAGLTPSGTAYHALISYRAPAPSVHDRDPGTGVDHIILPSGTVVASPGVSFYNAHLAPIDELADGTKVAPGCVWTGYGAPGNRLVAMGGDCVEWTSAGTGEIGYAGSTATKEVMWAFDQVLACTETCHVYCLQQ